LKINADGSGRHLRSDTPDSGYVEAVEIAVWWVLLFGLWMLTLSSVSVAESVTAAVAALLCAFAARAGRRASRVGWRPRLAWLTWFAMVPVALCMDTVRLFVATVRRDLPERFDEVELPTDRPAARADARRAAAVLALSATPGSVVLDAAPDRPLLLHVVVSGRPRLDERIGR
jgi:multisubunit Na+/H+ antiporter MnhE subunit